MLHSNLALQQPQLCYEWRTFWWPCPSGHIERSLCSAPGLHAHDPSLSVRYFCASSSVTINRKQYTSFHNDILQTKSVKLYHLEKSDYVRSMQAHGCKICLWWRMVQVANRPRGQPAKWSSPDSCDSEWTSVTVFHIFIHILHSLFSDTVWI